MAIVQGNFSGINKYSSSSSGQTVSHDNGSGSDRVTAAMLHTLDLNITATVTYNGVSLVEQAKTLRGASGNRYIWLFSKFSTSTGINNLVTSYSPNSRSYVSAVTMTGVNQSDTLEDTAAGYQTGGSSFSQTLTASQAGCAIIATSSTPSDSSGVTADAGTAQITYNDVIQSIRSDPLSITGSGAYTIGYIYASGGAGIAAGMFAPAGGGGGYTGDILSINGVLQASIANRTGVTEANIGEASGVSNS